MIRKGERMKIAVLDDEKIYRDKISEIIYKNVFGRFSESEHLPFDPLRYSL